MIKKGTFLGEDINKVLMEYIALIFIKKKDMEHSDTSVLRHFEIKKVVLGLLKSIKMDVSRV